MSRWPQLSLPILMFIANQAFLAYVIRKTMWKLQSNQCPVEANQTKLHMIRSDMLNHLWNPVSIFQEVSNPENPHMDKTITLSKVKIKVEIEITISKNIYL